MGLLFRDESFAIRGACFEVYRELGAGFLESVYQACLELELGEREIPFLSQPILDIRYKGIEIRPTFQPDLVCFGEIIVELKAVTALADAHRAQGHNYLKATGYRLGLLVNFGHQPKAQIERIVR